MLVVAATLFDQIERWLPLGFVLFFGFVVLLRRRARADEDLDRDDDLG